MIYSRDTNVGLVGRGSAWHPCLLPGRRICAQLAIWMPTEMWPAFFSGAFSGSDCFMLNVVSNWVGVCIASLYQCRNLLSVPDLVVQLQ